MNHGFVEFIKECLKISPIRSWKIEVIDHVSLAHDGWRSWSFCILKRLESKLFTEH